MAYPVTFSGWLDLIRDFLDVDDFDDAKIESFLSLGQTRLNRELNSQWMEKESSLTIAEFGVAQPIIPTIPDYNRINLVFPRGGGKPLDVVAINEYQELVGADPSGSSPALKYSIYSQSLYVYPYPAVGDRFQLLYYTQVPEISDDNPLNVFTQHHPDALIYAACLEGSRFIVEDERIPTWNDAYNQALLSSNETAKNSKLGSTPLKREIKLYKVG